MTRSLARWDDIDIHYRGSVITSTGHGFAGIERRALLDILARRACELEVDLRFGVEVTDPAALGSADVVVAADGMSSILRDRYAAAVRSSPRVAAQSVRLARYHPALSGLHVLLQAFSARALADSRLPVCPRQLHVHRRDYRCRLARDRPRGERRRRHPGLL